MTDDVGLDALVAALTRHARMSGDLTIMEAIGAITTLRTENARLIHDIERQISIANEHCNEAETLRARLGELDGALREMIRLADMGFEESMKEPEENGNYAAYTRAKRALERTGM